MGHTSATDVSSWISTGLTQVWSNGSYQPTSTGWNMYTLSTPFLWNGIDNIVVDTAFGLIGSYSSSGTTQYTSVTNGYRYGRSDSSDQTNVFSGGYNSSYRPNLKLALLPNQSGPVILVNPTTLAYGDVAVGSTDTKTFTIQNSGDQTLTGTITTPAGYTVAAARNSTETPLAGKDSRNSLSFSINAGATKTYNLTFAPTAATAYNGNVVITNNSNNNTSVNIAVSGTGYIPHTISVDDDALYAYLQVGTEGTDSFNIANLGSQNLDFTLVEDPAVAWFSANPTSGTVAGNGSQLVTGSFTAAGLAPGTYTANLLVNTNDPDNPQLTVSLTLEVLNALPVIELPADLSFDMNTQLVEDFSVFVSDADGHDLTLGYSGNTNIQISIDGMQVTFSAPLDWFGSEEITFSVFDGYGYAYDTVTVTVNLTALAIPEIEISKSTNGVTVSWDAVTNANCYHIYRATDPYGDYGTQPFATALAPVSYTHLRAHETPAHLVCRLLLEKKKPNTNIRNDKIQQKH